jgi:hypothetical protein
MTDQHLFSEGETAWLLGQPTKTSENTGAHWCATETGYVIYESRLELPRLRLHRNGRKPVPGTTFRSNCRARE